MERALDTNKIADKLDKSGYHSLAIALRRCIGKIKRPTINE